MPLTYTEANDLAAALLDHYIRGEAQYQALKEHPLTEFLNAGKKPFPGGKEYVREPVKGTTMYDQAQIRYGAPFLQGYSNAAQLQFQQSMDIMQTAFPWKEVHAGLVISWTELKKDGIVIREGNRTKSNPGNEVNRLVSLFEERMRDFTESWAEAFNDMLWRNGTQSSGVVVGVTGIINPTSNNTAIVGGISQATYSWWRHIRVVNIVPSGTDQTLIKTVRSYLRQLRKYGGRPNKALAGSLFIEALETELQAKGFYTMTGFDTRDKTNVGVADVVFPGLGPVQYDPWLDDNGYSKYCFVFDSRRLRLRPMEGEDVKVLNPERPYDYMVFLKSITWTGTLTCNQMNAQGVFSIL